MTAPDTRVDVRILLRDTATGEEAWHVETASAEQANDPDDNLGFYWTDGNGGCDCERSRCLHAALGRPDPNVPCGDSRIIIVEATVDGTSRQGWCEKA